MNPKVSVIMPAYNAERYIREAIESILNQTFSDFELIVINDGSTDGTLECIRSFPDPRIKIISNSKNLGIIRSRNIGLQAAKGEYIAKMDADDISLNTRLQRQVNYLDQHPEVAVLACKLAVMDESGELINVWPEDYYISSNQQISKTLPKTNCIGQPTVMMRAQVAKAIGYNKNYKYNEDWGMWLDALSEGYVISKLNEVLVHYRVHAKSTTVTENAKSTEAKTIKFRFKYLLANVFKPNRVLLSVSKGLFIDLIKFISPNFILRLLKTIKIGPFTLLRTFIKVNHQLKKAESSVSHLFFFPYYHSGGAEKVQASILETVADKSALVIITGQSANAAFLEEFSKHSRLIEVYPLLKFGPTYRWLISKLKRMCESQAELICFGSNSAFYYELIPFLPSRTSCIDLIHAFVHEYEDGPEKWSLPVVPRLKKRVVISQNTIEDLKNLYQKKGLDSDYLKRVCCITNFTDIPPYTEKPKHPDLVVLYVGRGSPEKRIHLISAAAKQCYDKKLPVKFHFVGDVQAFIPEADKPHCILHHEVHEAAKLNQLYSNTDVLLVTSSREGFPMVIMEAMARAVVPLSTNVGGISTHITSGVNGLLLNETDEEKIVLLIVAELELLLKDKERLKTLSNRAYHYAAEHFKKEHFVDAYRELLTN
jgi:L-malate glycosyltransferase